MLVRTDGAGPERLLNVLAPVLQAMAGKPPTSESYPLLCGTVRNDP